jgi:DNA-binding PadR family transcriptional regulator
MYRDKSLMPKEAIRLAALGFLAEEPRTYAGLADDVRHFASRFWGPTLDIMATSIELLRFEGLIEGESEGATSGDTMLRLTENGSAELRELLLANVRVQAGDFGNLVVALKMRLLHRMAPEDQREIVDTLVELRESELARLIDLRDSREGDAGHLPRWLSHNIGRAEADLDWFRKLLEEVPAG